MNYFVIDDHPLMREILVMLLQQLRPEARIIELERIGDFEAAVLQHGAPDFISLDLALPDARGATGVQAIRKIFPRAPLVVLTASPADQEEDACIAAGADAYVEKSKGADEILRAFTAVLEGEDAPGARDTSLSKRQKELLVMVARGMSNKEIAAELEISEHTVKAHLSRIFSRLGVKSRTQSIHYARTHGLISSNWAGLEKET